MVSLFTIHDLLLQYHCSNDFCCCLRFCAVGFLRYNFNVYSCIITVMIIDPGIDIDKGYPAYDRGIEQDVFFKVRTM